MLTKAQIIRLITASVVLWIAATLYIRLLPSAFTDPMAGSFAFLTTFPVAWLSVLLIKHVGRLAPDQLLAGVAVVGAVAMLIDGAALRFAHQIYGSDEFAIRMGAAWLLWGYGASLAVALVWVGRSQGWRRGTERRDRPSARSVTN